MPKNIGGLQARWGAVSPAENGQVGAPRCCDQSGLVSSAAANQVSNPTSARSGNRDAALAVSGVSDTRDSHKDVQTVNERRNRRGRQRKLSAVSVFQLNTHKSSASVACLERQLHKTDTASVCLVQEPWHWKGIVKGPKGPNHLLFSVPGTQAVPPRAALVCSKELNPVFLSHLSDRDIVCVQTTIQLRGKPRTSVVFVSAYLPGDEAIPERKLTNISEFCLRTKSEMLLCADANSHHTVFGSSDINSRGEELVQLMTQLNWHFLNQGEKPTFVTATRSEVLDVTICSPALTHLVQDWFVSDMAVVSDHRLIRCELACAKVLSERRRNVKKTNWEMFQAELSELLPVLTPLQTEEEVETFARAVERAIMVSFCRSCPKRRVGRRRPPPWWNERTAPTLSRLKKDVKAAFRVFKVSRAPEDWQTLRVLSRTYMREIRRAKRQSWRDFCSKVEKTSETSRLTKVLRSGPRQMLGLLSRPDGSVTETASETVDHLLEVHFPGCQLDQQPLMWSRNPTDDCRRVVCDVVTEHSVLGAINSLSPYKSPGIDGIYPVLLQKGADLLIPHLIALYRASFLLGYIPRSWRLAQVVFIPKPGKDTYAKAKSWRPISLTSFLLKVGEKLVDRYLKLEYLPNHPLNERQYAYQAGKSTETALHCFLDAVQNSLDRGEYAMACFLDIQGAFDNAQFVDIERALKSRNVAPVIVDWAMNSLRQRTVQTTVGTCTRTALTTQGTAQGGVLSALWFVLVIDTLLCSLNDNRLFTIGYSDDTTILLRGQCLGTLCSQMQQALDIVSAWCRQAQMGISAEKTQLMLFTKKYRHKGLVPIRLQGHILEFTNQVKYLGLYLTPRLTWTLHVSRKVQACLKALWQCRAAIRTTWGLKPAVSKWLYECVIRPMLTYGCLFFNEVIEKKTILAQLNKVQRLGCLLVTAALRTTPLLPLEVITGIMPIDHFIQWRASCTAYRLTAQGLGPRRGWPRTGYRKIWNYIQKAGVPPSPDYTAAWLTPNPVFQWDDTGASLDDPPSGRCFFTKAMYVPDTMCRGMYTDGTDLLILSLPLHCSAYQAEQAAIIALCRHLLSLPPQVVTICLSDRNKWLGLQRYRVETDLLRELWQALNLAALRHTVYVGYVSDKEIISSYVTQPLKRTLATSEDSTQVLCGPRINVVYQWLKCFSYRRFRERWRSDGGHRQSHHFLGRNLMSSGDTELILRLPRRQLFHFVGILTGHNTLNRHLSVMGVVPDGRCSEDGSEETSRHFVCLCAKYSHLRAEIWGRETITCELASSNLAAVLLFTIKSGRFD